MTADAQKLELIQWIATLNNQQMLQQIAELKEQVLPPYRNQNANLEEEITFFYVWLKILMHR